jgi:hypothetical protein
MNLFLDMGGKKYAEKLLLSPSASHKFVGFIQPPLKK